MRGRRSLLGRGPFCRKSPLDKGWIFALGLLLCVAAVLVPPAHSQPGGADSTVAVVSEPGRDWLPHGSYQTNYSVNRTVQTWTQTFNTPYSVGKLQLNTNVSYTYSTDSTNDRKTVNRLAKTSLNYLPIEGLKLGLTFDITRNNMETPTVDTRSKTDRDKLQLTGDYRFSPMKSMNTIFSVRTGGVDELLENRTVKRNGRGRSSTVDLENNYKPWDFLTWSVDLGGDFTSLSSEDSKTGLKTQDRNTLENYSTTLDLKPARKVGVNLSLRRQESQFQYPREEEQETKSGYSNGGNLRVSLEPLRKLKLNLSASSEHRVIDFAVERIRSTVTNVKSFSGDMRYQLLGAQLESRMSWDDQRDEYGSGPDVPISVLSQAGYLYARSLSGAVSRRITSRLEARASGNITLRSYQFDDRENNPDDRDLLNHTVSLDLTYNPSRKYSAGLGFSKRVNELVYISPEKSTNNREGETYTVTANLTYKMSEVTSISQNARMSADYSFYEFSESRDFLIRNTTLHTVFRTRLLRRIGLTLIHDYRYQDKGGVTKSGGEVFYGRTGDNDRQDLTISLNYEPVDGVNLALSQRFQDDKMFSIDEDERVLVSESERYELLGKMEVKYKISPDTDLDGRFERMDSSIEGKYWRVLATFRRNF